MAAYRWRRGLGPTQILVGCLIRSASCASCDYQCAMLKSVSICTIPAISVHCLQCLSCTSNQLTMSVNSTVSTPFFLPTELRWLFCLRINAVFACNERLTLTTAGKCIIIVLSTSYSCIKYVNVYIRIRTYVH